MSTAAGSTQTNASDAHRVTLLGNHFAGDLNFAEYTPATTQTYSNNSSLSIRDLKTVVSAINVTGDKSLVQDDPA